MCKKITIGMVQTAYRYVLPLSFLCYIMYNWESINIFQSRIMLCNALVFFVRIEHCFAFYRFWIKQSSFEYEVTIVLILVKIINSIQNTEGDRYDNIIQFFCWIFFNFLLCSNLLCYIGSFLIIVVFALVVLVGFVRGHPDFINPRRGLSVEELQGIKRQLWKNINADELNEDDLEMQISHELPKNDGILLLEIDGKSLAMQMQQQEPQEKLTPLSNQEEICSICLMSYQANDEVLKLPKCKHIFHSSCISEWLRAQPFCPFCRNNVRLALLE